MRKLYILFASLFINAVYSQVQKGRVTDETGSAIENAYILNANSKVHAHTNELGSFAIDKTNNGDILSVTALGYKKKEYIIKNNEFTIILEETSYMLDQVTI